MYAVLILIIIIIVISHSDMFGQLKAVACISLLLVKSTTEQTAVT